MNSSLTNNLVIERIATGHQTKLATCCTTGTVTKVFCVQLRTSSFGDSDTCAKMFIHSRVKSCSRDSFVFPHCLQEKERTASP